MDGNDTETGTWPRGATVTVQGAVPVDVSQVILVDWHVVGLLESVTWSGAASAHVKPRASRKPRVLMRASDMLIFVDEAHSNGTSRIYFGTK